MNTNKLPAAQIYSKHLNIASIRYDLTIDKCRDYFGQFTNAEWGKTI